MVITYARIIDGRVDLYTTTESKLESIMRAHNCFGLSGRFIIPVTCSTVNIESISDEDYPQLEEKKEEKTSIK